MNEPTITITVDAPDGLPPIRVLLSCDPKTQAEFNAVVKACGGPCAFTYHYEDSAHATLADDTTLILRAVEGHRSYERPLTPSISKLKAACKA